MSWLTDTWWGVPLVAVVMLASAATIVRCGGGIVHERPCSAFANERREWVPARCFRDFDPGRP